MDKKSFVGRSFIDDRGNLLTFNDFSLEKIKRMYQIEHPDIGMVRAWQGHKIENKWFYVIKGFFVIGYAAIDDFENPSPDITASIKIVKAEDRVVFYIPKGYANGLKSLESDSRIIVFSDLNLAEAKNDKLNLMQVIG